MSGTWDDSLLQSRFTDRVHCGHKWHQADTLAQRPPVLDERAWTQGSAQCLCRHRKSTPTAPRRPSHPL
eukprot:10984179-Lingulodinium_polyedra.AAC.1